MHVGIQSIGKRKKKDFMAIKDMKLEEKELIASFSNRCHSMSK